MTPIKYCPFCGCDIATCSTIDKDFTGCDPKDPDWYTYVAEDTGSSTEYYAHVDIEVTCNVTDQSWYTSSGDD